MPSNHLTLCHPLLFPPSIFSSISAFTRKSVLHARWPKYWSFTFSTCPSNEYSGLISFRMDWLDFLAVQGTLKSLLQHHSSKASILQRTAFFYSNSHIHTWLLEKPYLWLDVPLLAKQCLCLLTCCVGCHSFPSKDQMSFNFMATITICSDFGTSKNKVCHCFHCLPIYLQWTVGTRCHGLSFLNVEF